MFTYKEMLTENPNYDTESIVVRTLHIPVCPWPSRKFHALCHAASLCDPLLEMSDHDTRICEVNRRSMVRLCRAYRALLLSEGIPDAVVNTWTTVRSCKVSEFEFRSDHCSDCFTESGGRAEYPDGSCIHEMDLRMGCEEAGVMAGTSST